MEGLRTIEDNIKQSESDICQAIEQGKALIAIDNITNTVMLNINGYVYLHHTKEPYELMCFKSKETNKYICCVYKKTSVVRRGESATDFCSNSERVVSTHDKNEYIKFLFKYGHFIQEETAR